MNLQGKRAFAILVFLILQLAGFNAAGQVLDTIFPSKEKSRYLYNYQLLELDSATQIEDTVNENTHRIHPLVDREIGFMDLGLFGTPAYVFRLTSTPVETFDHGVHSMSPNFFNSDSIKLYRSPTPRTLLKYGQGNSELIYLVAEHSQNIFERWNFGLNYRRIKVQNWYYDNIDGLTLARIPNNYNFSAYSRFYTQNRKYEVVATYTWNKATIAETGGIMDTEKFDTLDRRTKQYFNSGYLSGASNIFKESNASFTQYFRFGNSKIEIKDNPDTVGVKDTIKTFTPKGHFYHKFQYHKSAFYFTDDAPNMEYYPVRLIGISTNDSFITNRFTNRFGLFLLPSEKAPRLDLSIDHDWIQINQSGYIKDKIHQLWLNGKISQSLFGQTVLFTGRYATLGYNAGDIHFKGKLRLQNRDSAHQLSVTGNVQYSRFRPSYMQSYFVSNHYQWHNDFRRTGYVMGNAGIKYLHHIELDGTFERFDDPVVFNEQGLPEQFASVQILSARLSNRIDMWRFHLKNTGLLKLVPEDSPIRYPLFTFKESFYYEGYFFKRNMLTRVGIDFYYYSLFKGNYYNPATRQYQLQNDFEIGNYPLFDLFITGKIRTVDIFFVYRHANAGLSGYDYYASPRYPQISSSARLGLSWRLYN